MMMGKKESGQGLGTIWWALGFISLGFQSCAIRNRENALHLGFGSGLAPFPSDQGIWVIGKQDSR